MSVDEAVRLRYTSEQYVRSLLRAYGRLASADSYGAVIEALRSELLIMLGCTSAWLQLVRPDTRDVLMLDCGGPVEVSVKALQADARFKETVHGEEFLILPYDRDPFISEVIRSKDIYVVPDARTHPLTDKGIVAVTGNRTMVCMPLVLAEKTIGCLSTGTFFDEGVMVPDEAQLDYLRQLAHHVAVAIDRVRFLGDRREGLEKLRSAVEDLEFQSFLLDSVMDGVIVRDIADMRVLYVNEALCAFAARTRDELLEMCDVSWICVGEADVLARHFDCAREAGSDTIETCAYTGIGLKTRVQVRTSIVVYRGRKVLLSVVRDISGR